MSYVSLVESAADRGYLHSVLLELTYRCNLDCFFCYNDLSLSGRQLSAEHYDRLLRELADMNVMVLALSGGEPLASPAFWPTGRLARELGFVVRVKSNGHALRLPVAQRLKDDVDPYIVEVSLHGATAETHERQTRVAGSFDRLIENLEVMRRCGLRVKLNSAVTRWNEGELGEMFELADRLELPITFDPVVTPRDDGDREPLAIGASPDGIARLYELHAERMASRGSAPAGEPEIGRQHDLGMGGASTGRNCGTGANTLCVDPFGNVYPCVQWRRPVGNLHDESIREIWGGSGALAEIRRLNAEAGERRDGSGGSAGFCLGLAEQMTGDPLAPYPQLERKIAAAGLFESRRKTLLPIVD